MTTTRQIKGLVDRYGQIEGRYKKGYLPSEKGAQNVL